MERTSENSSFIQLKGMHYLFFSLVKCLQVAKIVAAPAAVHAINAHTFFLFSLSPNAFCRHCRRYSTRNERTRFHSFFHSCQMHARRRTRNAVRTMDACCRCAAAA